MSKQKQFIQKQFSKRRNAVSESEISNLEAIYKLKDSIIENYQVNDQLYFSDSEIISQSSIQGKRRRKKTCKNKPVRPYNWNQPMKHSENYTLTVI